MGFSADDGATLLMTFRGLEAENIKQGEIHKALAGDLLELVANPFEQWAQEHRVRGHVIIQLGPQSTSFSLQDKILSSKATMLEGYVRAYEQSQIEVRPYLDLVVRLMDQA